MQLSQYSTSLGDIYANYSFQVTDDVDFLNLKSIFTLFPIDKTIAIETSLKNHGDFIARFELKSLCKSGNYLQIFYITRNKSYSDSFIKIHIEMNTDIIPDGFIDKYFSKSTRNVTQNEYYYFPGIAAKEIDKMKINTLKFKNKSVSLQGGYEYLLDSDTILELLTDFGFDKDKNSSL